MKNTLLRLGFICFFNVFAYTPIYASAKIKAKAFSPSFSKERLPLSCKVSAQNTEEVKKLLPTQGSWLVRDNKGLRIKLRTNKWIEFNNEATGSIKEQGPKGTFYSIASWDCDRAIITLDWDDGGWEAGGRFIIDLISGIKLPSGVWSSDKQFLFGFDMMNCCGGVNVAKVYFFGKKRDQEPKEIWNLHNFKPNNISSIKVDISELNRCGAYGAKWITESTIHFIAAQNTESPVVANFKCTCSSMKCDCQVEAAATGTYL